MEVSSIKTRSILLMHFEISANFHCPGAIAEWPPGSFPPPSVRHRSLPAAAAVPAPAAPRHRPSSRWGVGAWWSLRRTRHARLPPRAARTARLAPPAAPARRGSSPAGCMSGLAKPRVCRSVTLKPPHLFSHMSVSAFTLPYFEFRYEGVKHGRDGCTPRHQHQERSSPV